VVVVQGSLRIWVCGQKLVALMSLGAAGAGALFGATAKPLSSLAPSTSRVAASADAPTAMAVSTKGASFIRPHLRTLAPYTPIEPFEVLVTSTAICVHEQF
jgi:hypothetical protein